MGVRVKLPVQLRPVVGGAVEAEVNGATVGEALADLFVRFPQLKERIAEADGTLRRFVNVYVGGEDIRFLQGVETPLQENSELTILPALAGGQ